MVINGLSLFSYAPIKFMTSTKKVSNGRSYGLSEVGYDIRLKQAIYFRPAIYHPDGTVIPQRIWVDGSGTDVGANFCLASAIEEFDMPDFLVGVVHDKSTNIREGIQVFNTVIEPGWKGFLTLEIAFHGNKPITLEAGTPIAQVIFHEIKEPREYTGKYQNQTDKPVKAIYEE